MCFYLLSLISLFWLRGIIVTYGTMHRIYYIVFQMQRKIPLIAIFLGQSFMLLQKSKKYVLNMRSLSWMGTWNSTWAEVTYSKTQIYFMQDLPCARNLENNDILFCDEFTWNHECFLLFLEHSVSEKMEIISTEEQNACYRHEHTELYRWGFWWHLLKLGAEVPHTVLCLVLIIKEPVKAAVSLEIGSWRWWMADLWITFQFFIPKNLQYLLLPFPLTRMLPVILDNW